jgi:hypothetical protein
MPAEAGIQNYLKTLDSRLRGNDVKRRFKTFYETINIGFCCFPDKLAVNAHTKQKINQSHWTGSGILFRS